MEYNVGGKIMAISDKGIWYWIEIPSGSDGITTSNYAFAYHDLCVEDIMNRIEERGWTGYLDHERIVYAYDGNKTLRSQIYIRCFDNMVNTYNDLYSI